MISAIDQLIANVDGIILLFVQGSFGSFSAAAAVFWRVMFIIFIAIFGYKVMISGRFSASELLTNTLKIIIILAVATQCDMFFLTIYDLVTDLPADIAGQLITNASNALGGSSIATLENANIGLSLFYDRSIAITDQILEGASWYDFGIYLYAAAVTLAAFLFSGYAAMLIILSKIAVAILLAVGPIFILMLIFKNTQNLFEGWLRTLLNFALIPIFIYAVIGFFLILAESPLKNLEDNANVNAALLIAMAPFLLITVVGFMIMAQVMNMAASITGGLSLSAMGAGSWSARKAVLLGRNAPQIASRSSIMMHGWARHPIQSVSAARNRMSDAIKKTRGF
jgi:type IV secretion system protein VirB6